MPPPPTPYGSWPSPISAALVVSGSLRLSEPRLDGEDVYFIEGRPQEKGRNVIIRRTPDGALQDALPAPYDARSRAHEYGGGSYTVHDGTVYFTHFADQRIYIVEPGEQPRPLTAEGPLRYADLVVDARRNRLVCIVEDHSGSDQGAENTLAAIDLEGDGTPETLAAGDDFYSRPAISPDGTKLAWMAWNHPNMPWDGTEIWVADLDAHGRLHNRHQVAGGPEESAVQPKWSPDGTLYFISDRNDWWNLCKRDGERVSPVLQMPAEFCHPQWVFGRFSYGFLSPQTILAIYTQNGEWSLGMVDAENGELRPVKSSFTYLDYVQVADERLVCVGGSATEPNGVRMLDLLADEWHTLKFASEVDVDPGYLSTPQAVEFPTEGGLTAHGLYYPPKNKDVTPPEDSAPPLIVMSHGGPTSATPSLFDLRIPFWTSRGFAVLDVNYGGSTGYGRAYRQRLNLNWGVVDVQDCENGAKTLAAQGLADPERLIIRGGSAGGYTTLCALTFGKTFKAGASHYGIGDLETLATDTHKFESRYLDTMIGPYPQDKDTYIARSPVNHYRQIEAPVIFFQGSEDRVVPPDQSETMFEAVRAKEIPTAYVLFEGEGHGFRQAASIQRALEAELYFYGRVFGFDVDKGIEPVKIENL
ncbi:MAG: S9 family peptidase [Chloroflexi bacterium]|nr:S9 family peptidase [Chloroflexota bacterium]